MSEPEMLNLGSLLLGILAWLLPLLNMGRPDGKWPFATVGSISACSIALLFQICYGAHLVELADWSALLDTSAAVVFVSTVLVVVTIALNIASLMVRGKKEIENENSDNVLAERKR